MSLPDNLMIRICENEEAVCNGTPYNRHYIKCPECKEPLSRPFEETHIGVIKQVVIYDLKRRLNTIGISHSYRILCRNKLKLLVG